MCGGVWAGRRLDGGGVRGGRRLERVDISGGLDVVWRGSNRMN